MIERVLGHDRGHRPHQLGMAAWLVAFALGLAGCSGGEVVVGQEADSIDYLTPSSVYLQSGVNRAEAGLRLQSLRDGIDQLRKDTKSGWIGRQDDVTGFLTELTGGSYDADGDADAAIKGLLDNFGQNLFGISSADVDLGEPLTTKGVGTSTIRATQNLRGIPVLDGTLAFTISDPDGTPRVRSARGRVFAGLTVGTTPQISASQASDTAEELSGGSSSNQPSLVILPADGGVLAWQVSVVDAEGAPGPTAKSSVYFINAATGDVSDVRSSIATAGASRGLGGGQFQVGLGAYKPQASHRPVTVTGKDPMGIERTAQGIRTPNGIQLVDTTVPTYDPKSGDGAIITHTAQDSEDVEKLPGPIYTQRGSSTTIRDGGAIGAHAFARLIYDYFYSRFGWESWDGEGTSIEFVIHFGDRKGHCNAYFQSGVMVFGNPCQTSRGKVQWIDLEIAGHEVTHGVTDARAGLVYSGQSGALNESFSDYFGNVIGNLDDRRDDAAIGEDSCHNVKGPTDWCSRTPDGVLSGRYMLNGNAFQDYLRVLSLPWKIGEFLDQDDGGVHLNSSIWNNALWSIREQLAKHDGSTMLKSKSAQTFDRIVFDALTTKLSESSTFLDARNAIVETIDLTGADPAIGRVARQVFETNGICASCDANAGVEGELVAGGGATQINPAVHGDRTAWIDLNGPGGYAGQASAGSEPTLDETAYVAELAFAGDSKVAIETVDGDTFRVMHHLPNRKGSVLVRKATMSTVIAGLGGSEQGAAWSVAEEDSVGFVDPDGNVTRTRVPLRSGDTVTSVSTGNGTVGIGTEQGRVLLWRPGSRAEEIGRTGSTVRASATFGDRILAIDDRGSAKLFGTGSGGAKKISEGALPFGAAMNTRYVIWADVIGDLPGGVARTEKASYYDTDLVLYSIDTGEFYVVSRQRGQQGYPALSGNRLVWQDSALGGDDIMSMTLPDGL